MDYYDILLAKKLSGGGGSATLIDKNISANGTYNASSDNADGYKKVVVSVPNTYVAGDEGKVVFDGALVSQSSVTYDSNGTYDTTLKNSVTVNVQPPQEVETNDVTLIDYDGTALYSYTTQEFLALESLPPNPSHEGLTAQGWNWTLQQAKDYVTANEYLCIGQNYDTSDSKTHIIVDIPEIAITTEANIVFNVGLYTTVKNGVTIDWGDGNTTVTDANADVYKGYTHYYTNAGRYEVTLTATSGKYQLSYNGSNAGTFFANTTTTRASAGYVKKIYIGSDCTKLHRLFLALAFNVEEVSIPTSITQLGNSGAGQTFFDGWSLKGIVLPPNCNTFQVSHLPPSNNIKYISFGYGTTINQGGAQSSGIFAGSGVRGLRMLTLPSMADLGFGVINGALNMKRFCVPGTYTTIFANYLVQAGAQKKVVIPSTVTSIASKACQYTVIENLYLLPTTPPALASSDAFFQSNYTRFLVPYSEDHSILEAYKTASNWSTFADRFEEIPQ